jgi:hypothetical protein
MPHDRDGTSTFVANIPSGRCLSGAVAVGFLACFYRWHATNQATDSLNRRLKAHVLAGGVMDLRAKSQKVFHSVILILVFGTASIFGFYALMLAMINAALWLKAGHTTGYTVSKVAAEYGFANQQTGWAGPQEILDHVLAWPEWTVFAFIAVCLSWLGASVWARLDAVKKAERQKHWRDNPR